jgi:hypothetical protein
MPHGNRAAIILAVGMFAEVASIPAFGQMVPDIQNNRAPGWTPPPRYLDQRPPTRWSAVPAPGTGSPPGGISQMQAMNLLAAEGFTDILPPQPTAAGGWTAYAAWRGRKVRATVDPQGRVARPK